MHNLATPGRRLLFSWGGVEFLPELERNPAHPVDAGVKIRLFKSPKTPQRKSLLAGLILNWLRVVYNMRRPAMRNLIGRQPEHEQR